jgi:hypothetical protein
MSVLSRWKVRLTARRQLLADARHAHSLHPTTTSRAKVAHRKAQVVYAERIVKRHTPKAPKLTSTVAFDGVPTFRGLALMLQDCRDHGWTGRLNSSDRRKGVAERYGKLSQTALYIGYWVKHLPGYAPANPEGQSTHDLHSDGVAYRGPKGRPLSWWQLGLDVSADAQLVAVANRLGYRLTHPYSSGSEAHHLNLRQSPTRVLRARRLA